MFTGRIILSGIFGDSVVKNLPASADVGLISLGQEDPLKKEMATHSSILAWDISWTEDPGGLQSMGSQRLGHDLATKQQHHIIRLSFNSRCLDYAQFTPPSFMRQEFYYFPYLHQTGKLKEAVLLD